MAVLVDKCVFPGNRIVTLRDAHCQGRPDPNESLLFSTTLEQCDTQLKIDTKQQKATFRNTVIGKPKREKGVLFGRVLSFDFECTYDMNYTDIASDQRIDANVYDANTFSTGDLEYQINFYHDRNFTVPVPPSTTRRIGTRIYFEVEAIKPLEQLSFYVSECRVVELDTGREYKIIDNGGCLNEPLKMELHSSFTSNKAVRLSYTAFAFAGSSTIINQKVDCTVEVCSPPTPTTATTTTTGRSLCPVSQNEINCP